MSFLRGSQNFVWSTTSVLGKGATGAVYQGVNKVNGELVAVKTFNQLSHLRPEDVQLREFEMLKRVSHENIVKLLAIEEEQDHRGKVIVMELCTGGSLFNILDDPENTYGLEEAEFLLVLEHLTAGMKHLRDNNMIHRDLKPGNIMKFICDDSRAIYKLTDFGAARELQEGQHFQSLYGTEEYLHPDMYERAVLRKPASKSFGATIDLWSIGVTLYHVATGNLPFRPFGGRKNKETMYRITTKKANGVISGIQTTEDGQIDWKTELPDNCQLSAGLKKIVTPLLAGLLEADSKKIWSFDRFFTEVTGMLSRKPLNVFHVNSAFLIKVYIHPNDVYDNLQEHLKEQTGILPENQIILYKNCLFSERIEENTTRACGYPNTTEAKPIFLFNLNNNNVKIVPEQSLPKFSDFNNVISVESDAAQAKNACSIGYLCKRRIEKYSSACQLICRAIHNVSQYINGNLRELNQKSQHLLEKTAMQKKTAQTLQLSQQIAQNCNNTNNKFMTNIFSDYTDELKKISENFVTETAKKVKQLNQIHVIEDNLKSQWDTTARTLECPAKTRAPNRVKTLVDQQKDSWQHLVRDRATRALSYNDEQFHILERIKITQTNKRINGLLDEVFRQFLQLAENLGDWYNLAQTVYLQTMILTKDVGQYEEALKKFQLELTIRNEEYSELVKKSLDLMIMDRDGGVCKKVSKKLNSQKLKNYLKDFQKESKYCNGLVSENSKLIEQLNDLLENYNGNEDDDGQKNL